MTYSGLAWRSAWRRPLRTLMLVLCVAVAFVIFGLTESFQNGTQGATGASDDLLTVTNKTGRDQPLPLSDRNRIGQIEGVGALAYMTRLKGFSQIEKNVVPVSAIDIAGLAQTNGPELGVSAQMIDSLAPARDLVLVGRALAEAQGWSVGQSVEVTAFRTLQKDGSRNWRFRVAGIFDGANSNTDTYFMLAQYDYVNAARAEGQDTVSGFILRPAAGTPASTLAARVDAQFANTAFPTRTQSEKQFLEAFLRQFADIGLIVGLVNAAAFVTILMIVANALLYAMRERRFEIGLLKTLGFRNATILLLVLAESLMIFVTGGLIGLALSKIATLGIGPALGLVLDPRILIEALAIMLICGALTGLMPAMMATRMTVNATLRAR
ncbi:MAG: ABC transporter permease [Paenirhodobacter sp.]|uniref:ABC transporter permease n=1 Tax=Paenirhodobacter sp. TaxID=1965326 RepID=UPI003D0CA747